MFKVGYQAGSGVRIIPQVNGFSPADIPNLFWWLNAGTIAGADGSSVSLWSDLAGSSNATQATALLQPLLRTGANGENGKNVVQFNGLTQKMGFAMTGNWIAQPCTYFFAVKTLSVPTSGRRFMSSQNTASGRQLLYMQGGNGQMFSGGNLNCGAVTEDFQIWVASFNGASSSLWINGVLAGTGNAGSQAQVDGYTLGYEDTDFAPCSIGECGVYTGLLSTPDQEMLEDYLGSKFGIPITH